MDFRGMAKPNLESKAVQRRRELGIRQSDIAKALGVDPRTVSHWERFHHEPSLTPRQAAKYCDLLQCTIQELAEWLTPDKKTAGKTA
jgi:DNA-binding XRE family transcriptional regulator